MGVKFAVYEHSLVFEKDNIIKFQFIVLKDDDGNIILWTDFDKYARSRCPKLAKNIYSDSGNRCQNAAKLLNYVFFQKYHIAKLTDITIPMVKDFLNDYGLCHLPDDDEYTHRSQSTVTNCVSHTIDFLEAMKRDNKGCKYKIEDLYRKERVFSKYRKRYVEKKVPVFDVYYKPNVNEILRNLNEGAFQILMNVIMSNHKNILMLAACGAFAGMRPAECCNVRRTDSPLGPGILFETRDGQVDKVCIDLTEEKNLRSDRIPVGGIKRERKQQVYPSFLEAFVDCYNTYMEYISGRKYEEDYGALTNTKSGKAYTYESYLKEFQKAVKEAIPIMLESDDPKTVHFGHLLMEHNISPHIFRHWFSVKLTLYGETAASLMYWRGDTSPESALQYLMNKSDLEKEYEKVSDEVFNYSLWKAGKENKKDNDQPQ